MNLKECIEKIDDTLTQEQKNELKHLKSCSELFQYVGLSKWVRNNCDLWKCGTSDIETDIHLLADCGYPSKVLNYLMEQKIKNGSSIIDYNLNHPDNCSIVVLEMYVNFLNHKLPMELLN